jgi:hypothetical protein
LKLLEIARTSAAPLLVFCVVNTLLLAFEIGALTAGNTEERMGELLTLHF